MSEADVPHAIILAPDVRAFLERPLFAVVATTNPNGSPHTALVWYLIDDDGIVINSAVGRRWPSNLCSDPRISLAIGDGRDWVSLRGDVEVVEDQPQAQAHIAAMAYKYDSRADAEQSIRNQFTRQQRISFRLRATVVHAELGGD